MGTIDHSGARGLEAVAPSVLHISYQAKSTHEPSVAYGQDYKT